MKRADRAGRVRPFVVDSEVAFSGAYGEFWALIRNLEHQTRKSIEKAREKDSRSRIGRAWRGSYIAPSHPRQVFGVCFHSGGLAVDH